MILPENLGKTTKYTLVLDLFSLPDVLEASTQTSNIYIEALNNKGVINSLSIFDCSDWVAEAWKEKNLFIDRDTSKFHTTKLSLSKWSTLISSLNQTSKNPFTSKSTKKTKKLKKIDYRFTTVEMVSIDDPYDLMSNESSTDRGSANPDRLTAELLGVGVIRLFKDSDKHLNEYKIDSADLKHVPGDDTTLAILAVPFYFSASDLLLGFFSSEDLKKISHLRMIKSNEPNKFMVLLKLRSREEVIPFTRKYNGRKFNSFEPETCSVIEIKEILLRPRESSRVDAIKKVALPYLLEDPFTDEAYSELDPTRNHSQLYTELATCPVCLDRLDSDVSGLFTIPCQHTFHSSCLSKWKDNTCPVCRYSNKIGDMDTDLSMNNSLESSERCIDCGISENLWICLICGNVGCGRYDQKHAITHWKDTGHCFAMETNSQRVWDYAEDGYVHRLVQNEADGKIIELTLNDQSKKTNEEKVEKIGLEYSKMLITQLESQRAYYDGMVKDLRNELREVRESFERKSEQNQKAQIAVEQIRGLKESQDKMKKLNNSLLEKMKAQNLEIKNLLQQNEDLREQVRDLMFFLDSQEKLKDATTEVKEGKIILSPKHETET
jgi:BRCA1-associated protein